MNPTDHSQLSTRDADARTRHARLKSHFHRLIDLSDQQREAELRDLEEGEPELVPELRSLLAATLSGSPELQTGGAVRGAHQQRIGIASGRPASPPRSSASASSATGGRFAPGQMVDARYRIVALLGRGGMGEVYRAEDLKLAEQVALKFLPQELCRDPAWLERLHAEVRTARQISHANVVRVHDIGEADGQAFLSMEYVDGEDLASLIRRIGALPAAKAVEIARQLCAGLAAAHKRGVLHRDLKPANVMIDGAGNAKISDFGLAMFEQEATLDQAGTPAYMAPEQLRDGRASFASDIYALGLVLHELFTGQRAFSEVPAEDQARARSEPSDDHLSALVNVDPQVAKVVRACLRGPARERPDDLLQVARVLPGGDPLAVALAAGETPSPEMLRAAPVRGLLSRTVAASICSVAILAWIWVLFVRSQTTIATIDDVQLSPQVLQHQAEELLADLGVEDLRATTQLILPNRTNLFPAGLELSLAEWRTRVAEWWSAPLLFRHRSAPTRLEQQELNRDLRLWDPESTAVDLDTRGRLLRLVSVPPVGLLPDPDAAPVDWTPLFAASRLDQGDYVAAPPLRALGTEVDTHLSWRRAEGDNAADPELDLVVEAASRAGRVVFWQVAPASSSDPPRGPTGVVTFALITLLIMLGLGSWQSYRTVRSGRGDLAGAAVLAAAFMAIMILNSLLFAWREIFSSFGNLFEELSLTLLLGAVIWVSYMSLEPVIRRVRPTSHVSWARLAHGKVTDPLVARNFLVGFTAGALLTAVTSAWHWLQLHSGGAALNLHIPHWPGAVGGTLRAMMSLAHPVLFLVPFGSAFLLFLPSLLIPLPRARWFTLAAGVGLVGCLALVANQEPVLGISIAVLVTTLLLFLGIVGMLGYTTFNLVSVLAPVSLNPDLWWAPASWGPLLLVAALLIAAAFGASRRSMEADPSH